MTKNRGFTKLNRDKLSVKPRQIVGLTETDYRLKPRQIIILEKKPRQIVG